MAKEKKAVAFGNPKVIKEAGMKKKGGPVTKAEGGEAVVAKAEGGEATAGKKRKEGGRVPGKASGGRLDKRARGGGVGSDKSPFSSAHVKPMQPGGAPPAHGGKGGD